MANSVRFLWRFLADFSGGGLGDTMSIFFRKQSRLKFSFQFLHNVCVGTYCTVTIETRIIRFLVPSKWDSSIFETAICKGRNPFTGAEWYSVETGRRLPIKLELEINDAAHATILGRRPC